MIDFQALSLPLLVTIFAGAAALVWTAGTRLTRYADAISNRTGLGKAFTGMLLVGGITSLPEVAAVSTSAAAGNASLAINNLLGTASINVLLLALADIVYGRGALTSVAARPVTLMQGVLSMLLASLVAVAAAAGDVALVPGLGAFSVVLIGACVAALWISAGFGQRTLWKLVDEEPSRRRSARKRPLRDLDLSTLWLRLTASAAIILVAGYLLSATGDAISTATGFSQGLVGFVLVGFATSLPEISSITAALRLRLYEMAVGDVFGTNIFNIALIFLADIVYRGEPILSLAGEFESIGASLAVVLTGIFVVGLLERRDRTIFRMGYDSVIAVLVFAAGLYLLSQAGG